MKTLVRFAALLLAVLAVAPFPARADAPAAARCPGDGTVRMGLVPGEDVGTMTEVYRPIADALGRRLGCPVELSIATSYNAAIEAMRAKRLDIATFGPLSYLLAHTVANAEVIAVHGDESGRPTTYEATIITPKATGIKTLRDLAGHSFVYSDPASTSGHLFRAYALQRAGIDPNTGVRPFFAGSHTASFEALRNHKVDAGELNSTLARIGITTGAYVPSDFVTLWRSGPIPPSPVCARADLPAEFKARVRAAFLALDLSTLPDPKHVFTTTRFVPIGDSAYDIIRDLVKTMHLDLEHVRE